MIDVSVLTVVRNDALGLQKTIDSIRFSRKISKNINIKYFIVDGLSNDGTLEVILKNEDAINGWISESDSGIYDAMNKSVNFANSNDFMIWINSGDMLQDLSDLSRGGDRVIEADCIFGSIALPSGVITSTKIFLPYNEKNIFPKSVLRHQSFLIKKKSFLKIGGYNLFCGIQADGLLMSQSIIKLDWIIINSVISIFNLDGISNTAHLRVFRSYINIIRELNFDFYKIFFYQRIYFIKIFIKIIIPLKIFRYIQKINNKL